MPQTSKIVSFFSKFSKAAKLAGKKKKEAQLAIPPPSKNEKKTEPEIQAEIIEQEIKTQPEHGVTDEQIMINKIEAIPELKDTIGIDPMPPFTSVEQRLIDLANYQLHPYYKVYQSIPPKKEKKLPFASSSGQKQKSSQSEDEKRSDEEIFQEINQRLKLNIPDSEKPIQIISKLTDIEKNRRIALYRDKKK